MMAKLLCPATTAVRISPSASRKAPRIVYVKTRVGFYGRSLMPSCSWNAGSGHAADCWVVAHPGQPSPTGSTNLAGLWIYHNVQYLLLNHPQSGRIRSYGPGVYSALHLVIPRQVCMVWLTRLDTGQRRQRSKTTFSDRSW